MMKRFLLIAFLCILAVGAQAAPPASGEYIILVGGPSMYQWEKYKAFPHDHWWANFVRAARLRTEQLRGALGPDAKITWLVYRQGYEDRAKQEHQDLISLIGSVRDKLNLNLVWFGPGSEVIDYLNKGQPRDQVKVSGFEYFGHSNRACFMFDYSNNITARVNPGCTKTTRQKSIVVFSHATLTSRAGAATPARRCRRNGTQRLAHT